MKKKNIVSLAVILLALVMLLAACGGGNASTTESSSENASETTGSESESAGSVLEVSEISVASARDVQLASEIIVAKEEGFFEEEGLEVDLQLFQAGSDVTAAIAGGSLPIGSVGDAPATILKSTGTAVQLIAQQSDISGAQSLVVNPELIKTPADLNGKKVAYASGNTSEALFLRIVEKYGLDTNSMEIYKMGATEMIAAFQKKDIDAFVIWEPSVLTGVKQGGVRLVSASQSYVPGEEGPQKLLGAHSVLIANTDFAKEHPNAVTALLRALNKAVAFIEENPEKAAEHIAATLQIDKADALEMMGLNVFSLAITSELVEDIESTAAFLMENDKIKEIPDYSEFINASYLQEVDPGLVTWTP